MSEKELKDIWKGTGEGDQITLDLSQLEANLKTKTKKMDRILFFRDFREIFAAILISLFFAYKAYIDSETITKLTSLLYVLLAIYVIYQLLDVRKYRKMADLDKSFKNQLLQQKFYLEKQAELLENALYWYIGPFAIISTLSVGLPFIRLKVWGFLSITGVYLLMIYFFSSWLYRINKKAARTAFVPLIENIDNILIQLDED